MGSNVRPSRPSRSASDTACSPMNSFNPDIDPIERLARVWLRFVVWGLRMAAVCLVVSLPLMVVWDRFSPWPPAIQALSAYPGQSRLCVGSGSDNEETPTGSQASVQRSFVLFPRALTSPTIITVTSTDGAEPVVEESHLAFWFLFVIQTVALFFCVRLIRGTRLRTHSEARRSIERNR
jgi:hypothetical protein